MLDVAGTVLTLFLAYSRFYVDIHKLRVPAECKHPCYEQVTFYCQKRKKKSTLTWLSMELIHTEVVTSF